MVRSGDAGDAPEHRVQRGDDILRGVAGAGVGAPERVDDRPAAREPRDGLGDPIEGQQLVDREFVDHPEAEIRARNAHLLGEIGAPAEAALPALKEACNDDDGRVRMHATQAVKKIETDIARQAVLPESADDLLVPGRPGGVGLAGRSAPRLRPLPESRGLADEGRPLDH